MNSQANTVAASEKPWVDLPDGSAHGVFGAGDVLGTLNRQSPATVMNAVASVTAGRVFSLNLPLNQPDPPLFQRQFPRHRVFTTPRGNLDDVLDNFYPQSSSQWDGFLHVPDPELGFYNGLGRDEHGVHHWAERGIVGRGVVLDISEAIESAGAGADGFASRTPVGVDALEAARKAAGLEYQRGDILVVRTGWISWFKGLELEKRTAVRDSRAAPGLEGSASMAEYLWDHGFIAVVSDSPGVEAVPSRAGSLHQRVLARLGMPLGELWWLDDLMADCVDDGRYQCLVVSSPMNIVGGVGSPANAIAIK